jgi:[protein-PII] uridylyltransferase
MQFNMYHHYTVDEHLIRAVGNVAAIDRGGIATSTRCRPTSSSASNRAKRYVAILLHDIAKGLPGDHSTWALRSPTVSSQARPERRTPPQ